MLQLFEESIEQMCNVLILNTSMQIFQFYLTVTATLGNDVMVVKKYQHCDRVISIIRKCYSLLNLLNETVIRISVLLLYLKVFFSNNAPIIIVIKAGRSLKCKPVTAFGAAWNFCMF